MATKIFKPQDGFQEKFCRSNADITIGGGNLGGGKTFGALLAMAEYTNLPNFRGCCIRKTLKEADMAGGLWDDAKTIYSSMAVFHESKFYFEFPSGAKIYMVHVFDQENVEKLMERWKGAQYDLIYFDEGTGFPFLTFTTVGTRNRGKEGIGRQLITTNPSKTHWLRTLLDWYIGPDGFMIPERDGVVRYMYNMGETIDDVVTGASKEEVYRECKVNIDRKIKSMSSDKNTVDWRTLIKSFVFYRGKLSENSAVLGNNKGYAGSVAMSGGARADQLLEGNWNVDIDVKDSNEISYDTALNLFLNDPQRTGEKYITVDLADLGTDNLFLVLWDGFHICNYITVMISDSKINENVIKNQAKKWGVREENIFYDGVSGRVYLTNSIPKAIPVMTVSKSYGVDMDSCLYLKDCLYKRLIWMINNERISIEPKLAKSVFKHRKVIRGKETFERLIFKTELAEECTVVGFSKSGFKDKLWNKKIMNAKLGRSRSMDVLDAIAFRMFPILNIPYGDEISSELYKINHIDELDDNNEDSIYDECFN